MRNKLSKTSSFIIDLENSSFSKLNNEFFIYQYNLPSFFKDKYNEYALLHSWAKDSLNLPYYINTPTKKIYVLVPKNEKTPLLSFEDKELPCVLFGGIFKKENVHILLKLLMAKYFELTENFVSNDKFILHTGLNRSNNIATVLKIELRHNYKNLNSIEFFIKDTATRIKKISYEEYIKFYTKKIIYGKYIKNLHVLFKQLKRSEIKSFESDLYAEPANNYLSTSKSKINFHSIVDSAGHESSKLYLLDRFSTKFLEFLTMYGINVSPKLLDLDKIEIKKSRATIDLKGFTVSLIDGRMTKAIPLHELFKSSDEILFVEKSIADIKDGDTCLFVMDYNKDDFDGRFKGTTDPYKQFKDNLEHINVAKQGICVNENCFNEEDNESDKSVGYLNYKGLSKEDMERNLTICISQLFLKNVLLTKNTTLLPHNNILNKHCFCFRNHLLYVDGDNLTIEKFDSTQEILNVIKTRFTGLNIEQVFYDIYTYHNPYANNKEFDFLTRKFIFSEDAVIEIVDIPERTFYDEKKIKERIAVRNESRSRGDFRSNNYDPTSLLFNEFIDGEEVESFISYEELKTKYGKGETGFIKNIFGGKNETAFVKFLNKNTNLKIEGLKQDNVFSTYTGVWFDEKQQQYFVGRTHGYQQKQDKGSQMKKIVAHFGSFDKQTFFNLLNVDFIRYKEVTVNPFPFKMIEMFDTLQPEIKTDLAETKK